MKIQYCSDLHLEFIENENFINKRPLQPEGEILLLAGDILPLSLDTRDYQFFDFIASNFEAVYWIPGNHEYYGSDTSKIFEPLFNKIYSNVFLVNNQTVHYKDVKIICSTLWSHINPQNEWILQKSLADFTAIAYNGDAIQPHHFNSFHQTHLSFIKNESGIYAGSKLVVLTHHVPTLFHYPSRYKNSVLNEGFVVELHDYIFSSSINVWIYGHHHFNVAGFKIGNTQMLTNQLGYVRKYEHRSYKRNAIFEI